MLMRLVILVGVVVLGSCADPVPVVAPESIEVKDPAVPKVVAEEGTAAVTKPVEIKKEVPVPVIKKGEITSVDIARLFEMRLAESCLLIDVRPGLIYFVGHISGSISLPKKSFEAKFPKVKPQIDAAVAAGQTIILYCADVNCPDGYAVAKILAEKGYSTSIYKGGWDEWKAADLE
jgi:rhodanese-related sulfurtransferase